MNFLIPLFALVTLVSGECWRAGLHQCKESGKCLEAWSVCNGWAECPSDDFPDDKSDEEDCTMERCNMGVEYRKRVLTAEQLSHPEVKYQLEPRFTCKTSADRCLSTWSVCNGYPECSDGSDEGTADEPCTQDRCPQGMLACKDGTKCVGQWSVCNGVNDCADGSDEGDCTAEKCGIGRFACADGKKCIGDYYVCDGDPNTWSETCDDGSDEGNCAEVCPTVHKFTCADGKKCVDSYGVCNGYKDCEDNSDEIDCTAEKCRDTKSEAYAEYYGHDYYVQHRTPCADGTRCLYPHSICNGMNDCEDGSDEGTADNPCNHERCNPNSGDKSSYYQEERLACKDGSMCVSQWNICDGHTQCSDGTDEYKEGEPSPCSSCSRWRMSCDDGKKCISSYQICDGNKDCTDGSDEGDCTVEKCLKKFGSGYGYLPEDITTCDGGSRCTPKLNICNGRKDTWMCPNGDDEDNCPTAPFPVFEMPPYRDGTEEETAADVAEEPTEEAIDDVASMTDAEWEAAIEDKTYAQYNEIQNNLIAQILSAFPALDEAALLAML